MQKNRKGELLSGVEDAELSGRQRRMMNLECFPSLPAASLRPPASGLLKATAPPVENVMSESFIQSLVTY